MTYTSHFIIWPSKQTLPTTVRHSHPFSSAQNHNFLLFHEHIYFSVNKTEEFDVKNPK
jgi:hypothetical protein